MTVLLESPSDMASLDELQEVAIRAHLQLLETHSNPVNLGMALSYAD